MRARFHRHEDGSVSLLGTRERDLDRMRRFFALLRRVSGHYRAVMDRSGLSPEDSPVEVLGRFPVPQLAEQEIIDGPGICIVNLPKGLSIAVLGFSDYVFNVNFVHLLLYYSIAQKA